MLHVDIRKTLGAFHLEAQFDAENEVMALLGVAGSLLFSWLAGKYLLKHPKNESEDER